jgi:AAA+ superfamily predicted ATPase
MTMQMQRTEDVAAEVADIVEQARYTGPIIGRDQLIGVDNCLRLLEAQLQALERPARAQRLGAEMSGSLFLGPAGTGKTHVVKYLAGRLSLPLYQVSADQFRSDPRLIHGVFRALGSERAVLFIDEISIIAQRREWAGAGDRRMLSALLTSLDSLMAAQRQSQLWVVGACTPDIALDPAVYRSGRLSVTVEFALPSEAQRLALLELYLHDRPTNISAAELQQLASSSSRATGADIHDWVNQASAEALVDEEQPDDTPVITFRHLYKVVARRGFVQAERPGRAPTLTDGIHEAAHVCAALALFGPECLGKAKIGFGNAEETGRRTRERGHFALSDDWLAAHEMTTANIGMHAAVALAGASAEELFLGYRTVGSGHDVQTATQLVMTYSDLGDDLAGPARAVFEASGPSPNTATGSEAMRAMTWGVARSKFERYAADAKALVRAHRVSIERLAHEMLRDRHLMSAEEIVEIVGDLGGPAHQHQLVAATSGD